MGQTEGVAYFDEEQQLMMLEKGGSKPIRHSDIKVENRAAFFDDVHTYAADIPLDLEAEGLVTIGENTTLTKLAQAIGRMRGMRKGNQTIRLVLNSEVRKMISGDNPCTLEQILHFVIKNQARELAEDNFYADLQKVGDISRRAVLDKLLNAATENEMNQIFDEFEDLILTHMQDDPIALYGLSLASMKPEEAIKQFKKQHLNRLKSSGLFSEEEEKQIAKRLELIGKGHYPDIVNVSQKDGKLSFEFAENIGLGRLRRWRKTPSWRWRPCRSRT